MRAPPAHQRRHTVVVALRDDIDRASVLAHHARHVPPPQRPRRNVIALYIARPIAPEGRVLKLKVPLVHTAHGAFFRPRK